ncbi:DUF1552 domain-containing protein [Thalassoglobus sp. JC818]|uniref:DUF1552 domain-containing protein n=1 Tax=Thalassoglobus sp. JC818 TaxID=3232136 RepID=UPI0034581CFF
MTAKSTPPLQRRFFLKAAGASLTLPLLESAPRAHQLVASETQTGQQLRVSSAAPAKNLVCVGSNLGLYRPAVYPEQTGRDYAMTPLLEELSGHRNDFTIFSGLDHRAGNGHKNWDNYLCGKNVGEISLDQVVAEQVGKSTRFESIQLCAGDIPQQRMVYTRTGVPLPMINRPSVIYSKLFSTEDDRARSEYLLRSGRSSLDLVREEAKRLKQTVSQTDQTKLDEYFTSLRELELRMGRQLDHLAQGTVEVDYELPPYDPVAPTLMLECEQIMFDLMALALQTNSTRVMTLFIAGLGQVFTLDGSTLRAGYHALSHHGNDPDLVRDLIRVEQEHMKCLSRFLTQLKEKTDQEGRPLLDSTIVMFGTGMGDASRHSNRDLPTIVAGGGFQHGQHIAVDPDDEKSPLLGELYVTLLNQLGIETGTFSNASGEFREWTT